MTQRPSYKLTVLDNGLRVATTEMPGMKSASVGVWIGCGSRYENTVTNGVSHFIEHYVFKGTRRRSGDEICESIEGLGGELNASTSEESTTFYVKIIREKLALAVDVLLDMIMRPVFAAEYLEKQREIVIDEIHMYEDNPTTHVEDMYNGVMWGKHPLGYNILGTVESINATRRGGLVDYWRKMYHSANCVVTAAGDFSHDEFLGLVKKRTRSFRRDESACYGAARVRQSRPRLSVERKDTEQVHLIMGVPALKWTHPDRFALRLLSTILGENMSSRLFKSVREERGYAYSISTGMDRYLDTGSFNVSAGIVTRKIVPAIRLILREMSNLIGKKVSNRELDHAKEYIRGGMIMSSEQTMGRMYWLGESLRMANRVNEIEYTIDRLMSVTPADIMRVASELFITRRLNLALIGDISSVEPIEKALRFP